MHLSRSVRALALVGVLPAVTGAALVMAPAADAAVEPPTTTTESSTTTTAAPTTTTEPPPTTTTEPPTTTTEAPTTTTAAPVVPIAVDDALTIYANHSATVAVLANDTVPEGTTLRLWNGSAPVDSITNLYGVWTVVGETVVHTPPDGRTGPRSIQYVLTGADGSTSVATVRVQVNSISPPLILGEQVSTRFETALTIDVLANDFGGSNREGERYPIVPETLVIETPTGAEVTTYTDASGTWTVVDARIEFVPADDYWGNTRVYYRFRDSVRQRSSRGTVSMTVTPNPDAADDAATGYLDQVVTVGVTANDFTPPGTTIDRVSLVAANGNGTVSIVQAGVGTWTYQGLNVVFTPVAGFLGSATAPYRIVNNRFHTADATVTVTIAPLPEVEAVDDTVDGFFGSLRPSVEIDVLANDSSATGAVLDPSTLALVSDGGQPVGELVVDGEGTWRVVDGHLEFTPVAEFRGAAMAAYTVANDLGSVGQATATVNVRWATITARPDFAWIGFRDVAVIDVADNDRATGAPVDENSTTLIGPDGEPTQSYETSQGVWSVVDGSVHFEPHRRFRGIAIAPYQVDSGITTGVGYVVVLVTSFALG